MGVSVLQPHRFGAAAGGPVTATHVTGGNTSAAGASAVTASVTPSANKLQLLLVHIVRGDSVNVAQPSTVVGCGLTWVLVRGSQYDVAGGGRGSAFLYRALGTPTTGTVTITFGYTAERCAWSWDEFGNVDTSGADGAGAVVQAPVAGVGTTNNPTVTMAAFASPDNATYGGCAHRDTGGALFVPGTGFAELGEHGTVGTQTAFAATEWRVDNDTTVDGTVTTGGSGWAMFGVEIKRAA